MSNGEAKGTPAPSLGVRDLVLAAVDADQHHRSHPDLESYYTLRYVCLHTALAAHAELRTHIEDDTDELNRQDARSRFALASVMRRSIVLAHSVPNPFREILEGPPEIADLYRRRGGEVYGAAEELRQALINVALDVLLDLEPDLASRTTTETILQTMGLPTVAPDALDYW